MFTPQLLIESIRRLNNAGFYVVARFKSARVEPKGEPRWNKLIHELAASGSEVEGELTNLTLTESGLFDFNADPETSENTIMFPPTDLISFVVMRDEDIKRVSQTIQHAEVGVVTDLEIERCVTVVLTPNIVSFIAAKQRRSLVGLTAHRR